MQKTTICSYGSAPFSHLHLHSLQRHNHLIITYTTFLCSRNASNKSNEFPVFQYYFFRVYSEFGFLPVFVKGYSLNAGWVNRVNSVYLEQKIIGKRMGESTNGLKRLLLAR
jgi:hypothetical protein